MLGAKNLDTDTKHTAAPAHAAFSLGHLSKRVADNDTIPFVTQRKHVDDTELGRCYTPTMHLSTVSFLPSRKSVG